MTETIRFNADMVMAMGDIHGEFMSINNRIKTYDLHNTVLILCGDISFGFNKEGYYRQVFNRLKRVCDEHNIYCIFIRGNHDDPSYFRNFTFNEERFKSVPDYTVLEIFPMADTERTNPTHTVLCIGGATSIDRTSRKLSTERRAAEYMKYHRCDYADALKLCQQEYWEDEAPYYDEDRLREITDDGININYVCTHTSPPFCQPYTKDGIKGWLAYDPTLERDIDNERKTMENIYDFLKSNGHNIVQWTYGHYHFFASETIDGIRFVLLGIEDISELKTIEKTTSD